MQKLPPPTGSDLTSSTLPSAQCREIIGNQIDLPGRFPILTDGIQTDLEKGMTVEKAVQSIEQLDRMSLEQIQGMVTRLIGHARKKLKKDGRNLADWKYTVMVAVHHKGQATDFWFGDGPEKEVRVDQSLDEKLRKPGEAERIKVAKR